MTDKHRTARKTITILPLALACTIFLPAASSFADDPFSTMKPQEQAISIDEYAHVPTGLMMPPDESTVKTDDETSMQAINNNLPYSKIVEMYRDKKYAEIMPSLELLASQHHHGAEELLGIMHMKGQGTPKDPVKGYAMISRAAEAGRALALHHLAIMTYTGTGVEEDHMRALMWMHIAIAYYPDGPEKQRAIADRKVIYKNLSRRQKEAALRLAIQWLEKRGDEHLLDPENIEP
jgi:TPR repeat protein